MSHIGSPQHPQPPPVEVLDDGGGGASVLAWTAIDIEEMKANARKIAKKKTLPPLNLIFVNCFMICVALVS